MLAFVTLDFTFFYTVYILWLCLTLRFFRISYIIFFRLFCYRTIDYGEIKIFIYCGIACRKNYSSGVTNGGRRGQWPPGSAGKGTQNSLTKNI